MKILSNWKNFFKNIHYLITFIVFFILLPLPFCYVVILGIAPIWINIQYLIAWYFEGFQIGLIASAFALLHLLILTYLLKYITIFIHFICKLILKKYYYILVYVILFLIIGAVCMFNVYGVGSAGGNSSSHSFMDIIKPLKKPIQSYYKHITREKSLKIAEKLGEYLCDKTISGDLENLQTKPNKYCFSIDSRLTKKLATLKKKLKKNYKIMIKKKDEQNPHLDPTSTHCLDIISDNHFLICLELRYDEKKFKYHILKLFSSDELPIKF